jgi:hypothetical protein
MNWGPGYSLIGLIILILEIIVLIDIFKSGMPTTNKLLWAIVVIFFPVLGMILYYFLGKGK